MFLGATSPVKGNFTLASRMMGAFGREPSFVTFEHLAQERCGVVYRNTSQGPRRKSVLVQG